MRIFPIFVTILWLTLGQGARAKLSPLAERPDWSRLEAFQDTMTREEFTGLLDRVYAPGGAAAGFLDIQADRVLVTTREGGPVFVLRFARGPAQAKVPPRGWRAPNAVPARTAARPLQGLRITLDPGHLGGEWAKMEERWFRIGNARPVTEGDMTLHTARLLAARLRALGAEVTLTRRDSRPATKRRPEDLRDAAAQSLRAKGQAVTPQALKAESERLFYRTDEIMHRARTVNRRFRPDLVLALHFNAESWGDPARPTLTEANHLHLLVHGAYSRAELEHEDMRFHMLSKLLDRSHAVELPVARSLAAAMARATGLPPYVYRSDTAVPLDEAGYVWARNLLANRLFAAPTIYLEPYVMNSREVHERVQAGDYQGLRTVAGRPRRSIYREYVEGVVNGLVHACGPR